MSAGTPPTAAAPAGAGREATTAPSSLGAEEIRPSATHPPPGPPPRTDSQAQAETPDATAASRNARTTSVEDTDEPLIVFTPVDAGQRTSRLSSSSTTAAAAASGSGSTSARQLEPQRRRPSSQQQHQPATLVISSSSGNYAGRTSLAEASSSGGGGAARVGSATKTRRASNVGVSGGTPLRGSGLGTPRVRAPPAPLPEDEELTQLARSLRSEIVGEHFLLTAGFSASSRGGQGCSSGSRPPSTYSNVSSGAAREGGGSSGDRRGSAGRQRRGDAASSSGDALAASGSAVFNAPATPVLLVTLSAGPIAVPVSLGTAAASASSRSSPQNPTPPALYTSSFAAASLPRPDSRAGSTPSPPAPPLAENQSPVITPPSTSTAAGPAQKHPAPSTTTVITVTQGRRTAARSRRGSASASRGSPRRSRSTSVTAPMHDEGVGQNDASPAMDGGDDLHTVAELRRRLLTEDFFSSPIRKLRRDGKFPWKLFTSVVLCVLLILQVSWYQLPLARANESMRRAITEHFMGDGYASKGHGDIVPVPTVWMEGLYASVAHYVEVYYNLSNTSSSDMNYYTATAMGNVSVGETEPGEGGGRWAAASIWQEEEYNVSDSALRRRFTDADSDIATTTDVDGNDADASEDGEDEGVDDLFAVSATSPLLSTTTRTTPATFSPPVSGAAAAAAHVIPVTAVAPVRMRVKVDVYSRREGAQHVNASISALAALSRGNWWGWTSSSTLSAGRYVDDETEDSETRWLTFYVDAAHPLGPFAKYRDAARRLSRASKQRRRLAHALRKAEKAIAKGKKKGKKAELAEELLDRRLQQQQQQQQQQQASAPYAAAQAEGAGEVDAVLAMVCTPRLDELSGRYYRPCASVPQPIAIPIPDNDKRKKPAATSAAPPAPPPPSSFFPEFSLMDNVREIRLEVLLRHETGWASAAFNRAPLKWGTRGGGEDTAGAALRRRGLQGITGSAVENEAAVFQWRVEKVIEIHPGGLVETQLHVETRIWPKGNSLASIWGPSHWLAVLLGLLGLLELILRGRALWRIRLYTERLRKERLAFHARQMHEQGLHHRHRGGTSADPRRYHHHTTAVNNNNNTHTRGGVTCPFSPVTEQRIAAAAALPYEWGLPGSPAIRHVPDEGLKDDSFAMPASVGATQYGTITLPPSASAASSTAANVVRAGVGGGEEGGREAAIEAVIGTGPLPHQSASESTPLLMKDTSLSILALQHMSTAGGGRASFLSDAAGEAVLVPAPCTAQDSPQDWRAPYRPTTMVHRVTGSWFGRQLSRVFPRHLTHIRQRLSSSSESVGEAGQTIAAGLVDGGAGQPVQWEGMGSSREEARQRAAAAAAAAAAAKRAPLATPNSAMQRGSFRATLLGGSPLTPQLTERILERSYVDLRTTWRHHLQQSMGTGWHVVGLLAASLTLCYSALLLVPLLPCVDVAQDGRYDAWASVLLGTAALTSCVLLLSYLRFFPTFYFPILASTHVLPKLFLFALCVSPLFFGFAFFFKIAFGLYSDGHFETLGWASMGLYMMTYGDSLLDTVDSIANTPYAVTAFLANVMVIVFALLFMMIMLNIAMTITQHEWLRLRRRFGAALNTSTLLFAVRSRAEVKAEAVEAVRTNLEVLWFLLAEEEEEEAAAAAAAAETERASGSTSVSSDDPLRPVSSASSVDGRRATEVAGGVEESHRRRARRTRGDGGGRQRQQQQQQRHHRRRPHHQEGALPQQQQRGRRHRRQHRSANDSEEQPSGSTSRRMPTWNSSSYEVSAATTAPPE